jgi:radical SAM family uncharacterized protein
MGQLYPVDLLLSVSQPGQYVGGERNAVVKDHDRVRLTIALAYPDAYSVGMSHPGLQILYAVLNDRDDVAAERAFVPRPDMERALRDARLPLLSLETHTPLRDFDAVGFSLQHEMTYTNLLTILELGGIPLLAAERGDDHPVVIAGGPGALAPEPLADFIDLFVVGDGEPILHPLADALIETKGMRRSDRLPALARGLPHVYAPSLYNVRHGDEGRLIAIDTGAPGVPARVRQATVGDLDAAPFPTRPVVPLVSIVHRRVGLEIMRGCTRGCRFCQAGMTKRPVRARSVETLLDQARAALAATGYDEINLGSLSSSDYPELPRLLETFAREFGPRHVSVSVPSLRVNEQLRELPKHIRNVRKSGLTLAPEAATEAVRRTANKMITAADLFAGVRAAYESGWARIKLYFMIGLPGETERDVAHVAELADELSDLRKADGRAGGHVNVTIASFIPKPHTPFQWEPMAQPGVLRSRQELIKQTVRRRKVRLKFHRVERSLIEAVFARGDRRLGRVLLDAWRRGARMDAWDEHFRQEAWDGAFAAADFDPVEAFALRPFGVDELLPWSMIDTGVSREYLQKERARAGEGDWTPDCREAGCLACGVCAEARET